MRLIETMLISLLLASGLSAAKTLEMYVIDVEGGKSLLIVSPSGESMLVDAGNPGNNGRDAGRIVDAVHAAGLQHLDYLLVTHYDGDHVGNVPAVVERIPVTTFVDHGANVQAYSQRSVDAYLALAAKAKRIIVKAGDRIPIKGVDAFVAMAAGKAIEKPLKGAGQPNPACETTPRKTWGPNARGIVDDQDTNENAMSIGLLLTYGKFRMYDPADLTWNKDRDLMCPINRVGVVDLYMVSNHGTDNANSPVMVHALRPRVAIVDNAARKGGTPAVFDIVKSSPGLEDYWQMHYSLAGGEKANVPPDYIANLQGGTDGNWIRISVQSNGTFTVTNARNNFSKTYKPRKHT